MTTDTTTDTTEARKEFKYLNRLRASGAINMFGAAAHVGPVFGLDRRQAKAVVSEWMQWVEADPNRLDIK
jgi:hypothetical protein